MMSKTAILDELELFIFRMMVEKHEDLIKSGFIYDLERPFDYTEEQAELLVAQEAQENIMRKLHQLQGIDDPCELVRAEEAALFQAEINTIPQLLSPENKSKKEYFILDYLSKQNTIDMHQFAETKDELDIWKDLEPEDVKEKWWLDIDMPESSDEHDPGYPKGLYTKYSLREILEENTAEEFQGRVLEFNSNKEGE